jgi:predicted metal-binding membrane protein
VDADAGQTWLGAAASFLGMWIVMMIGDDAAVAGPMLTQYRQAVGSIGETRRGF